MSVIHHFFKNEKKNPLMVSHHPIAIWILFLPFMVAHRPCIFWPMPTSLTLSYMFCPLLSSTAQSRALPSHPLRPFHTPKSFNCFSLFPKTLPWLALSFSAQHTHHPWKRFSGWPKPNKHQHCSSLPYKVYFLHNIYHHLKVAIVYLFTLYLSFLKSKYLKGRVLVYLIHCFIPVPKAPAGMW